MCRAVFLDRDGVLNKVVMRGGKVGSPRTLEEFAWEAGTREAVAALKARGLRIIVVTNQPDIARGKLSRAALNAMTDTIYRTLSVDSVRVCPHDDGDGCRCRKPKPGMLLDAAALGNIDCRFSFMVGDSWKDMEAGYAAGCRTILLGRPYNRRVVCDHRVTALGEAVELILKRL